MRIYLIVTICFLSVLFGCSLHAGLIRTPVKNNTRLEYPTIGFSISLPVQQEKHSKKYRVDLIDSELFRKNAKLQGKVYFGFHPIHGVHPMSEPDYLIDINAIKFSGQQFNLLKQKKHYLMADPCLQNTEIDLSPTIKEKRSHDKYNKKDYQCFFKTMSFKNGDILVLSGRLLLSGNLYNDNDMLFIRNTINSAILVED